MPHSTIEKAALAKSIAHELRLRGDIARERDPLKEDPKPDDTVKVLPERLRAICAQFSVTNSGAPTQRFERLLADGIEAGRIEQPLRMLLARQGCARLGMPRGRLADGQQH